MKAKQWLACLLLSGCGPVTLSHGRVLPRALAFSPVELAPPSKRAPVPPSHFTLPSGVDVFLVSEAVSPLVSIDVLVACGRVDDPEGQAGLTGLMLDALLQTGVGALDHEAQLAKQASLGLTEVLVDDAHSQLSMLTRATDFERAAAHLGELLRAPSFLSAPLAHLQDEYVWALSRPGGLHSSLVRRTQQAALFGSASPLSAMSSPQSIKGLTRDQVLQQFAHCVQPRNVTLAIAGPVAASAVKAAFSRLENWPEVPRPAARSLVESPPQPRRVFLIPSDHSKVVAVTVVGPGLPAGTDQRATAVVLQALLMGQLWGLRSDLGAVYNVGVDFDVGPTSGMIRVSFSTRQEHARAAVEKTVELLEMLWSRWPWPNSTTEEVTAGVGDWWASQSSRTLALDAARALRTGGGPLISERLSRVSMNEVRALFVRTLKPSQVQILVSGDVPKDVHWSDFGPVTRVSGSAEGAITQ